MNIYNSGNIIIAEVADVTEYEANKANLQQFDFIIVEQWQEGLLKYPTNISFKVPNPGSLDDYLLKFESSKRSSLRKRMRTVSEKYQVVFTSEISPEQFIEWEKGYRAYMLSLPDGRYHLSEDWFAKNASSNMGLFFYLNGKMQGGAIVKLIDNSRLSISYAWYGEDLRRDGGQTFVTLFVIKECIKDNLESISFGQDTNLFGGHLSVGLHDFKTSWHSIAYVPKRARVCGLIINDSAKTKGKLIFYTLDAQDQLVKNIIDSSDGN